MTLSASRDTDNASSDISKEHTSYNVTGIGTNAGYLWFNLDEDEADTVVMQNQGSVNVVVLDSSGNEVEIEDTGVFSGNDYQVFEGANGPWYLRISSTDNSISSVRVSIARAEGDHGHEDEDDHDDDDDH